MDLDMHAYIEELDNQSPICSTSHYTFMKLCRKYSEEKVVEWLDNYFRREYEFKTLQSNA